MHGLLILTRRQDNLMHTYPSLAQRHGKSPPTDIANALYVLTSQDYNTAPLQSPSVQVGVLNWVACATSAQGQPHTASDVTLQGHYDVILASDVVYDPGESNTEHP